MATFHVGRLEIAHQAAEGVAALKIQGASLSGEECPAISWEEFQVGSLISPFFTTTP